MKDLVYVELKTGYADNGPAWIGRPSFSKSKSTVYFNGLAFKRMRGSAVGGNYFETASGDEYWISGVKKNTLDRHWAGSGKVVIDDSSVEDYLRLIGEEKLPKHIRREKLRPSKPSQDHHQMQNESLLE